MKNMLAAAVLSVAIWSLPVVKCQVHAQTGSVGIGTPQAQLHTTGTVRMDTLIGVSRRLVFADSLGHLFTAPPPYPTATPHLPLPLNGCPSGNGVASSIVVSGLPNVVPSPSIRVRVDITHDYVANIRAYLVAPNGAILNLIYNNGANASNFTNTVFSDASPFVLPVSDVGSPFSRAYKPRGSTATGCGIMPTVISFGGIGGGGVVPNGTWTLRVYDSLTTGAGTLNNWSISFDGTDPAVPSSSFFANGVVPRGDGGQLVPGGIYDVNGNIGIGTSSPTAKLDVMGKIRMRTSNDTVASWGKLTLHANDDGSGSEPMIFAVSTAERMRIDADGNVGIGTNTPATRLHVADSSVLFSAAGAVPGIIGPPPASGAGRRMMWYADKGAFRAGYVSGSQWDKDSIGLYSFATGSSNIAGPYAFAVGSNNRALGEYAVAMGNNSSALANFSFAAGFGSRAVGVSGTAIGQANYAVSRATSIGFLDSAIGITSVAIGSGLEARSWGEVVVGTYNEDYAAVNMNGPQPSDRVFVVGNGMDNTTRSNALTVLKNGAVGIGTSAPTQPLHIVYGDYGAYGGLRIEDNGGPNGAQLTITPGYNGAAPEAGAVTLDIPNTGNLVVGDNLIPDGDNALSLGRPGRRWGAVFAANGTIQTSDMRLKKDVEPLSYGLKQVLPLCPITFNWKDNSNTQRKVGFSAQEMQALMPELVSVGDDEAKTLGVNYGEVVPVLVRAIQEQQTLIDALQKDNESVKQQAAAQQTANAALQADIAELRSQVQQVMRASSPTTANR